MLNLTVPLTSTLHGAKQLNFVLFCLYSLSDLAWSSFKFSVESNHAIGLVWFAIIMVPDWLTSLTSK